MARVAGEVAALDLSACGEAAERVGATDVATEVARLNSHLTAAAVALSRRLAGLSVSIEACVACYGQADAALAAGASHERSAR